jgi:hypothetical protein
VLVVGAVYVTTVQWRGIFPTLSMTPMWRTDTYWFDVALVTTLPGVNGWTAEPRDRYDALIGLHRTKKTVDH